MNNESDYLIHYGVKGMKWGVRRSKNKTSNVRKSSKKAKKPKRINNTIKTKNGETLNIIEKKNGNFIVKNSSNKKVGTFFLDQEPYGMEKIGRKTTDNPLHIDWLSVSSKQEGKGYATAMMDFIEKYAKDKKYDSIVGEVVGVSPSMKRIVDNNKYKTYETVESELWGGLTVVEKKF